MCAADPSRPLEIHRVSSAGIPAQEIHRSERGTGLEISWSQAENVFLSSTDLRRNCPCAGCQDKREKASGEKTQAPRKALLRVIDATLEEETNLTEIWPVGNYAIGLRWGDGHDTGIYSFDLLREFSSSSSSREKN